MPYTKTTWVDGSAPAINASNLNKLEQGIADAVRTDGSTTMSGQFVTVAGSATTPAIAPTGDSNNGIYFPTSDQMAYSASGVQRLLLDINSIKNFSETTGLGLANVGIVTQRTTNDSQLYISYRTTPDAWVIGATYASTGAYKPITFATSDTERMRILSTGNVGIGTSTVASVFGTTTKVYGATGATIETSSSAVNLRQFVSDSLAVGAIGTSTNHPFYFLTNDTERMRITATGNVGIGDFSSNNPVTNLSISSLTGGVVSVTSKRASGTIASPINMSYGFYGYLDSERARITSTDKSGNTLASDLSFFVNDSAGTMQNRLYIAGTGNVGIGTTSPASVIDIQATQAVSKLTSTTGTNSTYANITNTGGTLTLGIDNSTGSSQFGVGNYAGGLWHSGNYNLTFGTNGSCRMAITGAGNVGIGTTSPARLLEVSSATNTYQRLTSTIDAVVGLEFYSNGTQKGLITGDGNGVIVNSVASAPVIFKTNNTENMRILSGGNVGVGDTAPVHKLSVLGTSATTASTIRIQGTFTSTLLLGQNANGGVIRGQGGSDALSFWTGGDDATAASGSGTERMRIASTGFVGIGTTSPSELLNIDSSTTTAILVNSSSASGFSTLRLKNTGTSGREYNVGVGGNGTAGGLAGSFYVYDATATLSRFIITSAGYALIGYTSSNGAYPLQVNGQIFATSSTIATSDQKYKKNIVQLTDALSIVSSLNPVQFDWKEHPVHKFNTDVPTVGFIAQEVAEALKDQPYLDSIIKKSECSWEEETGDFTEETTEVDGIIETIQKPVTITKTEEFLGIAESNMIAILTKAVQELSAKVIALEAQIK